MKRNNPDSMNNGELNSVPGKFRKKAEELVKKKLNYKTSRLSESDAIRLNHELQVHQIELELINEELYKEKKQAEATAEKYSELYYSPMGYFTLTKKYEIIDVNPTGANMIRNDRMDLLNRSFSVFISEESKSVFELFITRIFRTKTIQSCDLTLIIKDTTPCYVYMNGLINSNSSHCHLIAIDITERKKAEKEYQRLLLELGSAQTKLKVALESGNIGIWEWDLLSGELMLDEKACNLFGAKAGPFGKTIAAFKSLINDEDFIIFQEYYNKAIKKDLPVESIVRTKINDKKSNYINIRAYIRKDTEGNPIRLTGVIFDVSALKETEKTILKLNEDLMRSNRDLESFAYVASHDLQEPLRMVSSFVQLLSKKYDNKLDEDAREYIGFAVEGAKRMYDLLNALLTYSRLNSKFSEFSSVDMNRILEIVKQNLKLIIRERNVVIKSDVLPSITADGNQMMQLLQNLITNAIKFSNDSPMIFITSRMEEKNVVFSVRDEGIGIEEQYFEKIFKIFQRLNPRKDIEGIGIGLSICKRIVERHKGSIWVESEPGKGSVFSFSLPKDGI